MRKKLMAVIITLVLAMSTMALVACGDGDDSGFVNLKLNYNYNGETQDLKVAEGGSFNLSPSRSGYNFIGWYSDEALTTAFDVSSISEDSEIYACWSIFSISVWENKASIVGLADGAIVAGGHLNIPAKIGAFDVVTLGNGEAPVFYNGQLSELTIPSSVAFIANHTFNGVASLTKINFAESASELTIGEYAFLGTGITSLVIPSYVKTVLGSAFQECASLVTVEFLGTDTSFGPVTWSGDGWTLTLYGTFQTCTALESITVPVGSKSTYIANLVDYNVEHDIWVNIIAEKA